MASLSKGISRVCACSWAASFSRSFHREALAKFLARSWPVCLAHSEHKIFLKLSLNKFLQSLHREFSAKAHFFWLSPLKVVMPFAGSWSSEASSSNACHGDRKTGSFAHLAPGGHSASASSCRGFGQPKAVKQQHQKALPRSLTWLISALARQTTEPSTHATLHDPGLNLNDNTSSHS